MELVHISQIRQGDTIMFKGILTTVTAKDIKNCEFMGITIFGDSFRLGYNKVERLIN